MLFIFLFSAFRFPTAVCIMECILPQYSKPAKEYVKPMADDRIPSVMNASFKRGDDFATTIEYLKAKGTVLASHRSCVSSYTSHHIERYVKKRKLHEEHRAEKKSHPSEHHEFNFRSNCLFCNEPCKEADPKNPSRSRPYYVVRTAVQANKMSFKDFILKICALRNDSWSRDEQFRVESTISDLHAADARYYQDCKTEFLHSSYVERLANSSKEEMDLAFPSLIRHTKNNEKET